MDPVRLRSKDISDDTWTLRSGNGSNEARDATDSLTRRDLRDDEKRSKRSLNHAGSSRMNRIGGGLNLGHGEARLLCGLTLLGSVVRFWKIGRPSSVV